MRRLINWAIDEELTVDINSISSGVVTENKLQKVGDAVGVQVARKALDIQSSTASQLIDSVENLLLHRANLI